MTTEIIVALITALGVIASAFVSWRVSVSQANKEIKKLQKTWEHEKSVSFDDEFAEMVSAVSVYANSRNIGDQYRALEKVSAVRAKATGPLADCLDELHHKLETDKFSELEQCLSNAITEHRKKSR